LKYLAIYDREIGDSSLIYLMGRLNVYRKVYYAQILIILNLEEDIYAAKIQ